MLRKIAAISFLLLHVYNLVGYKAMFAFLESKADRITVTKIDDNQYDDGQLLEIRIAYPQLYNSISTDYQRFYGNVEINGRNYNYVKRKFANDTLYLLCLPDKLKDRITIAKKTHIVSNTAAPEQKKSTAGFAKYFSCDYFSASDKLILNVSPSAFLIHHSRYIDERTCRYDPVFSPPPEMA